MTISKLDAGRIGIVVVMAVALTGALCSENLSGRQGRLLERLQADLPVPGSFTLVSERTISKLSHAVSTRSYACPSPYSEIRAFYVSELEQRGWRLRGEKEVREWGEYYGGSLLVFTRDELELSVQFSGRRGRPNGWDYAISVSWQQGLL